LIKEKKYPVKIQGDYITDDFFKANPWVGLYPFVKDFRSRHENASKIFWCFFLMIDIRSPFAEREDWDGRYSLICEEYYMFNIDEFSGGETGAEEYDNVRGFFEKKVMANTLVVNYVRMKAFYDRNLTTLNKYGQMDIKKKIEAGDALEAMKNTVYGIVEEEDEIKIQGAERPGMGARRLKK
jgi:hypothetical protein